MYYEYLSNFKVKPASIEDLFEGICYLSTKSAIKDLFKEKG